MYLNSNLRLLRIRKTRTQEQVAEAVKTTRATINNYERDTEPPLEMLISLSDYFGISVDTLVKVNLHSLSEPQFSELENGFDAFIKGGKLRILATTVDKNETENIHLVSVKATAGYTSGYNDPEYISALPSFQLPFLSRNKTYRTFQIQGDSMLPVPDKSYIIAEYVQNWQYIKDGHAYIVVTESDGVVFKVVYNQVRKKKNLLLKSLNSFYKPYEVPITEVREVWSFVQYFTNELPEPFNEMDQMKSMFNDLTKKVEKLTLKTA
ncbi:MAG: XRE family transcriptional regulator [Bacteroidia bacterium]